MDLKIETLEKTRYVCPQPLIRVWTAYSPNHRRKTHPTPCGSSAF